MIQLGSISMRFSKSVLGCITAAAIFAGGSSLPAYAQTAPPAANMAWSGPYVGAYAGFFFVNTIVGLRAGYNVTFGQWVASAEASIGMINGGGVVGEVTARGRIGALVRPRFLAYASATLGYIPFLTVRYLGLGGGIEFAVADDISVFTEVGFANTFSVPGAMVYQLGVHWHP
jgi:hypothetical protein